MRTTLLFGLPALLSATLAVGQQSTAASPVAPATTGSTPQTNATPGGNPLASEFYTGKFGPFTVAAGPATGGGFGVSVDGGQGAPLTSLHSNLPTTDTDPPVPRWYHGYMGSLGYKVDGLFTTRANTPNNASISLEPGFDFALLKGIFKRPPKDCAPIANPDGTYSICPYILPTAKVGFGMKGDVEYRYGTLKSQDGTLVNSRQALVGGGFYVVPTVLRSLPGVRSWLIVVPQITASYYKPVTTNTSAISLPANVTANYLQTEFHTEIGWNVLDKLPGPITLDIKYDGTRPFTGTDRAWQSLWKLQLSIPVSASSVKPAVTYQSGAQAGFQYDKEVIFGFVAELFKPTL